jgi:hypothetical protein
MPAAARGGRARQCAAVLALQDQHLILRLRWQVSDRAALWRGWRTGNRSHACAGQERAAAFMVRAHLRVLGCVQNGGNLGWCVKAAASRRWDFSLGARAAVATVATRPELSSGARRPRR